MSLIQTRLERLFNKVRKKHRSVEGSQLEGMGYYDGFRAGLAWTEQILADEINVELGWPKLEREE